MLELKDFQPFNYDNLVRRGSTNDGGYLLPSDISAQFLISLGLGDDWKFELDLIKHKQVDKFVVFDHSVTLLNLLKILMNRKRKLKAFIYRAIVLIRYFRDFTFLRKQHVKKKITRYGSIENFREINLNEIFKEFIVDPKSTIILKIDIEGSEFDLIEQVIEFSSQTLVLIIEFHEILKQKDQFKNSLELLKSKFLLIHTHVNNYGEIDELSIPNICEFTFINHDIYRQDRKVNRLPRVGLDSPSTPNRPDYELIYD
jgi:SepF-like predicted cell division protein (DUF552 family)